MTRIRPVAPSTVLTFVALLIGGCAGGTGTVDTPSTAIPTGVTASPTESPTGEDPGATGRLAVVPLRDTGGEGILDPGTYVLDQFPVDLAFDIPDGDPPGWHVGYSRADVATILWYTPPDVTYAFAFWSADNLYRDPCDADAGELDPPVGPLVDDLVVALSQQRGFRATDPVDVTVGDFRGKEIELTAVDLGDDCPSLLAWTGARGTADPAPGEKLRVQIVDVGGVRIVMHALRPARPDAAVEADLQEILESIRIQPQA